MDKGVAIRGPHCPVSRQEPQAAVRLRVCAGLTCAGLFALCWCISQASEPSQQKPPVFRSGIDVVRLDVAVLDRERRPIGDLEASDFTILVDNVPQPIVVFEPVVVPTAKEPSAAWMRETASDVRANGRGEPRLIVIIMDDVMTNADPTQIQTAKAIGRAIIEQLTPGDLAAVLFTDPSGRRGSQDLTNDRSKLFEAVERFNFGIAGGPAVVLSQRTLRDVLAFLRDRPQNRSSVIVIGPGLGRLPTPDERHRVADNRLLEDTIAMSPTEAMDLTTTARFARIPVYWFDIKGLVAPGLVRGHFEWGGAGPSMDSYQSIVRATGGRAIANTNAPVEQVRTVFEENSVYYLLGYRPTYSVDDGRGRRLRISVNRDGAVILPNDRLIWSKRQRSSLDKPTTPPLLRAMADILPQSDLPLQVAVAPFAIPRTPKGATATIAVSLGVRTAVRSQRVVDRVQVLGKVFTISGKLVGSVQQEAALLLGRGDEDQYELLSRIDVKPGRYLVRYSVHSAILGKTGSVYTDITVPDYQKSSLSLSPILIAAVPGPRSAPVDALASLLPVMPTTERAFTAKQEVTAFVRLYQGGKRALQPVTIDVSLRNARDLEQALRGEHLEPARFSPSRAVDYSVTIPTSQYAPGEYLVTFHASVKNGAEPAAVSKIRFTIR